MKLTKYTHACIALEEQGQKLLIDPGAFTDSFGSPEAVAAVVITHSHSDHYHPEHLQAIMAKNPDVKIFTTPEVAAEIGAAATAVQDGQEATVGPFRLHFSGSMHQQIHDSLPTPQNTAVTVNDVFFYPGDSFTKPAKTPEVLAIPANAPWTDVAGTMDYLAEVKPKRAVPTHNGLLSDAGNLVYNGTLTHASKNAEVEYVYLKPGESIEM
jgi:L-ascorbate metabolism protein UlaG (beta-lactamase superfamily)